MRKLDVMNFSNKFFITSFINNNSNNFCNDNQDLENGTSSTFSDSTNFSTLIHDKQLHSRCYTNLTTCNYGEEVATEQRLPNPSFSITFPAPNIQSTQQQQKYQMQDLLNPFKNSSNPLKKHKDSITESVYDVFLGGSCGSTVWRSEIVIPYLKKRAITYYDPQRPVWSENMIQEEFRAKENSELFLFVLDPGTINATSFLEIAYLTARNAPKLVVVFLGRREWSDKAHPMDLPDRIRTCNLLEAILKRHSDALDLVDEIIIGKKSWIQALANPLQRLPYLKLKGRHLTQNSYLAPMKVFKRIHRHVGAISRFFGAIFIGEILILFLLMNLLPNWPLLIFVFSFIALDYLAIIGIIIFYRVKVYQEKKQKHRQNPIIPVPPLPRYANLAERYLPETAGKQPENAIKEIAASLLLNAEDSIENSKNLKIETCEIKRTNSVAICMDLQGQESASQDPFDIIEQEIRNSQRTGSIPTQLPNPKTINSSLIGGYDVFLSSSSSNELDWITQKAIPQLHKTGLTYTSALMYNKEKSLESLHNLRIPMLHTASHILYYIPSYKTFLSGMIEIAYFIGHLDWRVTVCVPREAECLILLDAEMKQDPEKARAVQRRNECYHMAFCYLKDLAQRRQCHVFTKYFLIHFIYIFSVKDAIKHIANKTQLDTHS